MRPVRRLRRSPWGGALSTLRRGIARAKSCEREAAREREATRDDYDREQERDPHAERIERINHRMMETGRPDMILFPHSFDEQIAEREAMLIREDAGSPAAAIIAGAAAKNPGFLGKLGAMITGKRQSAAEAQAEAERVEAEAVALQDRLDALRRELAVSKTKLSVLHEAHAGIVERLRVISTPEFAMTKGYFSQQHATSSWESSAYAFDLYQERFVRQSMIADLPKVEPLLTTRIATLEREINDIVRAHG